MPGAPYISASGFLANGISEVRIAALAVDERSCDICYQVYSTQIGPQADTPVRIKACGHVFGRVCITRHALQATPYAQKCPICRDLLWQPRRVPMSHPGRHDLSLPLPQNETPQPAMTLPPWARRGENRQFLVTSRLTSVVNEITRIKQTYDLTVARQKLVRTRLLKLEKDFTWGRKMHAKLHPNLPRTQRAMLSNEAIATLRISQLTIAVRRTQDEFTRQYGVLEACRAERRVHDQDLADLWLVLQRLREEADSFNNI